MVVIGVENINIKPTYSHGIKSRVHNRQTDKQTNRQADRQTDKRVDYEFLVFEDKKFEIFKNEAKL